MRVAIICRDRPGAGHIRAETRPAHLDYVRESGKVEIAGPFLDETGEMTGSLLILAVESLDEARAWLEGEPYAQAGLFEEVTVSEWKKVIG
jgi:hypothetical protein